MWGAFVFCVTVYDLPMDDEIPVVKKSNRGGKRPNTGGARPGAGRKPFVPTQEERRQVETMSGYGLPVDQIAVSVRHGIDPETLRKHFSEELVRGKSRANAQVAQTLFSKVLAGDTTAAIFWCKTQLRWSERHEVKADVTMTDAGGARERLAAVLAKLAGPSRDEGEDGEEG